MNVASAISRARELPLEQLTTQASRAVPPWLSLALAVALAWNLGHILWLVVPPSPPTRVAPPPTGLPALGAAAERSAGRERGGDVRVVVEAHLFGEFDAREEAVVRQPPPPATGKRYDDLQETSLPIKLLGVLADDAGGGQAVIVDNRGQAKVYRVSDRVDGQDAVVEAIHPEWVQLRRGRADEKLTLPDFEVAQAPTRRRTAVQRSRRRPDRRTQDLINQLTASGELKLTDLMRPQPVFENNRLAGYRVYPGRDRDVFNRLGLRPGDLVTQVNGSPLDDPAKGFEIFRQLETSVPIAVTVERGGQVETIILDTGSLGLSP